MKAVLLLALALVALGCSRDEPPRANLLLVTIDTLRADHLGAYGYPRAISPSIDRLAREGILFERASTPRAKTTPALASLFTGSYPHEHGVRELLQPLDGAQPLFAESLAHAGWQCVAIVGNFVLQARHSGLSRGFHAYVESLPSRQGVPPDDVPQRTARSLTQAALVALGLEAAPALDEDGRPFEPAAALLDRKKPWFLWLHYMDPHGAYEPPAEHRVFGGDAPRWIDPAAPPTSSQAKSVRVAEYNVPAGARDERGRFDAAAVTALYDGEVRHADSELGRLVEALRAEGELARTWIVVTSDHGESLGEQDDWFEHGFYAYESTCRVPLIVRPPDGWAGRPAPGRREGALSLADLGPSLAQWLDVPAPVDARPRSGVRGRSRAELLVRDDPAPHATFSEKIEAAERDLTVQIKAVRWGDHKLVRRWTRVPAKSAGEPRRLRKLQEELYDLARDPLEAHDLAAARPSGVPWEALNEKLLAFEACDAPFDELERSLEQRRAELEASEAQALRYLKSLGY